MFNPQRYPLPLHIYLRKSYFSILKRVEICKFHSFHSTNKSTNYFYKISTIKNDKFLERKIKHLRLFWNYNDTINKH